MGSTRREHWTPLWPPLRERGRPSSSHRPITFTVVDLQSFSPHRSRATFFFEPPPVTALVLCDASTAPEVAIAVLLIGTISLTCSPPLLSSYVVSSGISPGGQWCCVSSDSLPTSPATRPNALSILPSSPFHPPWHLLSHHHLPPRSSCSPSQALRPHFLPVLPTPRPPSCRCFPSVPTPQYRPLPRRDLSGTISCYPSLRDAHSSGSSRSLFPYPQSPHLSPCCGRLVLSIPDSSVRHHR